jgi:non-heme chloroperoxidase
MRALPLDYVARHGESRVEKAVIISAVPPLMVKTATHPGGLPKEVFDGFQAQLAANRAQFYYDVPAGPFYGDNRPGAKPSQAVIWNWWRQGMMGGAKAHYDGIMDFATFIGNWQKHIARVARPRSRCSSMKSIPVRLAAENAN